MLYWVDIPACKVCRCAPGSPVEVWPVRQECGCIAPQEGGGLVLGMRDGVYTAREWGGDLALVAPFPGDTSRVRCNDGKADPAGRFWAGTYCEVKDVPCAALYSLGVGESSLKVHHSGFFTSNGLAWSPDGNTVYWADTSNHRVVAWDWDSETNTLGTQRVLRQFEGKPQWWVPGMPGYGGRPDGAVVDTDGHYWVAMYEGGCVLKLCPITGQTLETHSVPALCPTMPCLGPADADGHSTLYVTTVSKGRSQDERLVLPLSGCVLAKQVKARGLPVNFCSGL
ncbi:senescence marker protein-30 [Kipferlia bialata]|uniref:Senescence marker protein-30 n=1 Tax=Kipferlia bialata TaxID=797122 RepID=A0A9K3GEH9_9EUKA|nr:senescence marker protein-30 [Kipferlia bialata]|eukprot:g167.t1